MVVSLVSTTAGRGAAGDESSDATANASAATPATAPSASAQIAAA